LTCILSDNNSCLDDPLEDGETPTSAHATLKTIVDNLIQDTVQNPYIKVNELISSPLLFKIETDVYFNSILGCSSKHR